jgi:hypothetical protein
MVSKFVILNFYTHLSISFFYKVLLQTYLHLKNKVVVGKVKLSMFENCEYDCKLCDVPLSNVYDRNLPSDRWFSIILNMVGLLIIILLAFSPVQVA